MFFPGHLQPNIGTLEGVEGALVVRIRILAFEPLFSALLGFLRTAHIDLVRPLRCLGENCDFGGQYLGKSPSDRKLVRLPVGAIGDFAYCQFGNQRRVSRKDTQIAVLSWDLRLFRGVAHHLLLRGNDLELEDIGHQLLGFSAWRVPYPWPPLRRVGGSYAAAALFIFSARCSTSSIVPTM